MKVKSAETTIDAMVLCNRFSGVFIKVKIAKAITKPARMLKSMAVKNNADMASIYAGLAVSSVVFFLSNKSIYENTITTVTKL